MPPSNSNAEPDPLTRREREMMDILYAGGVLTAREIGERMAAPPTDATVRTILRVLERKGHIRRRARGKAHEYEARRPARSAARLAVRRLVDVFFGGSVERAMTGLLDAGERPMTAEELDRLERLIRATKSQTPNPKSTP
jgi:BlaI family penicillinase repressor